MNINYIIKKDLVTINSDDGSQRQEEYYDNIDEVLIQENLIETIEKQIENLEKLNEEYEKPSKFKCLLFCTIISIIASILIAISNYFVDPTIKINSAFGLMSKPAYINCWIGIFSTFLIISRCRIETNIVKYYKEKEENDAKLNFLKKELEKEKAKLDSLKQDKTRSNKNIPFKISMVDDNQKLMELHSKLIFYKLLSYNLKKYCKYYDKGQLKAILENDYSKDEIEEIKEYIKYIKASKNKI